MVMLVKFIVSLLVLPFVVVFVLPMRAGTSHHLASLKGRKVMIPTLQYGDQVGEVQHLGENPVYKKRGLCAYVTSLEGAPVWAEWIPVSELPGETCCDCEVHYYPHQLCEWCGNCQRSCCDCNPRIHYVPEGDDCMAFLREDDEDGQLYIAKRRAGR